MTDITKLQRTLTARGLFTAKSMNGEPVLSRSKTNPELAYIHINDYVKLLAEKGLTINEQTLQIKKTGAAPKDTPKKTETAKTPKKDKPTDTGKYTKAELEAMTYKDLQKVAGADPDIPGNKKKAELVKLLTGRPKFDL